MGHLTDVYLTRYRSLKWSFAILILAACLCVFSEGIHIAPSRSFRQTAGIIIIVVLVVHTFGLGLFRANAIQFGLDQLLEAPTPKLIAFIHWYYWAQNVGNLVLFYAVASYSLILLEVHVIKNGDIYGMENSIKQGIFYILLQLHLLSLQYYSNFAQQRSTSTFRKLFLIHHLPEI